MLDHSETLSLRPILRQFADLITTPSLAAGLLQAAEEDMTMFSDAVAVEQVCYHVGNAMDDAATIYDNTMAELKLSGPDTLDLSQQACVLMRLRIVGLHYLALSTAVDHALRVKHIESIGAEYARALTGR